MELKETNIEPEELRPEIKALLQAPVFMKQGKEKTHFRVQCQTGHDENGTQTFRGGLGNFLLCLCLLGWTGVNGNRERFIMVKMGKSELMKACQRQ